MIFNVTAWAVSMSTAEQITVLAPAESDLNDAIPLGQHTINEAVDAVTSKCLADRHGEKLPPGLPRVVSGVRRANMSGMIRM